MWCNTSGNVPKAAVSNNSQVMHQRISPHKLLLLTEQEKCTAVSCGFQERKEVCEQTRKASEHGTMEDYDQFGSGLFTATSPQFAAQPGFGFEQCRLVQPRRQGIVRRELPRLARQDGEDVLRDLLRRARVFQFAERRGEDEIEMPPHDIREALQ